MEVIRIPQVSLVDATGRRIGVYTDDPDWWQQLKLKHHNQTANVPAITAGPQARPGTQIGMTRQVSPITMFENGSTSNLKARLIKNDDDDDMKKQDIKANKENNEVAIPRNVSTVQMAAAHDDKQCNVIGETPLHIAIMYDDMATIKFLIEEKGFDVNQRNTGGKFQGGFNNKLTANLIQQSKYEGLAYYGEYPLAFAACFANKEIYDYMIEKGADPNLQDTNGNTVLHVLVINNKLVIGFFFIY